MRIHHVQLAMPAGEEDRARRFYGEVLGMTEVAKPETLAGRGGVWFRHDTTEIHLGVETPFTPARKAHPGLEVDDLDAVAGRLEAAGHPVIWDDGFPGRRRCYVDDAFGNRVEILSPEGG